MKQLFLLVGLAGTFVISCKKDAADSTGLNGNWRMVEVYDKNTNSTLIPPAENGNDLVLSFTAAGFSGHTLRNTISEGEYTVSEPGKIRFGVYSTTQVNEDMWGIIVFTVLNDCLLQSLYPCNPVNFSVSGNTLEFDMAFQYKIKMERF